MYQATIKTKKSRVVVIARESERAVDGATKIARQFGLKSKRFSLTEINENTLPSLPAKPTRLRFRTSDGKRNVQFSVMLVARGKRGDWDMVDWVEYLCASLPDGDWELHGLEVIR